MPSDTKIRSLANGAITIFSHPFSKMGVPLGGRSTAIKLKSGGIWMFPSTPIGEDVKSKLSEMGGDVKYLVAADIEHTMFLQDYAKAYPQAKLYGPEGIEDKLKDLSFTGLYKTNGSSPSESFFADEGIESCYFKSHQNKDIAFLHKDSKTLIEADLLFNLPGKEQHGETIGTKIEGSMASYHEPGSAVQRNMLWAIGSADRDAFAKSAKLVSGWDFDTIIPSHGETIESGGKQSWNANFRDFLDMA